MIKGRTQIAEVPQEAGGILVLSPHFDDAVLGCGAFLAERPGSIVLTVCAGVPPGGLPLPEWDRRCGFESARQAMQVRREENRRALHRLHAMGLHLDLLDSQYGGSRREDLNGRLTREILRLRPRMLLFPLGLFHEDHIRVSNAVLRACLRLGDTLAWIAYEDVPYRRIPGLVQQRLAVLGDRGIRATPWLTLPADLPLKRRAVTAYASQLGPLGLTDGGGDAALPEHFWRLNYQRGASV